MKKILITLFVALFCSASAYAACADAKNCPVSAAPQIGVDVGELSKKQKERETEDKKLKDLVSKHNSAAPADKAKIRAEIEATLSENFDKNIAFEVEQIKRQREKLDVWAENVNQQQKDKAGIVSQNAQDLIDGKDLRTPWDKLKEKTEAKSDQIKKKAMKTAAQKGKNIK